jgi:hypothetical protein
MALSISAMIRMVSAKAVRELDILFPKHIAHVWSLDGF